MKRYISCVLFILISFNVSAKILPGAYQLSEYLPLIKNKRVGLLINQTSEINGTLLLDTLLQKGINVKAIFVPEHGFRGTADAGAKVKDGKDPKTGITVYSLYGNNKKPSTEQLSQVDVLIYDLQDVGVRFYTYISTLQYAMEACAESKKTLIVLDRPNPLGNLVDGPVLDVSLKSFVGMQPIPIVYGLTAGEYANMLVGENWVKADHLNLIVIPLKDYKRNDFYAIPIAPSPNLRNNAAIFAYPTLCLFEGTAISVGRGTNQPFQQWGHPSFASRSSHYFIPKSVTGASKPLYENQKCYGPLVAKDIEQARNLAPSGFSLQPLLTAYKWFPDKDDFFNNFFDKLSGDKNLKAMIKAGASDEVIRKSWKPKLEQYKLIRQKYLIYEE